MLEVLAAVAVIPMFRAAVAPIPVCQRTVHWPLSNDHLHIIPLLLNVSAGGGAGGCAAGENGSGGCTGAIGGSGVVIISYPVAFKPATTTGKDKNC